MSHPPENAEWTADRGRRRSLRVLLSITVIVRGKDAQGRNFEEETKTLVVNAHGALIHLRTEVRAEERITLINKRTEETQVCRVVYAGAMQGGKAQVGIEFAKPSPKFWQISFPPDDWNVPED